MRLSFMCEVTSKYINWLLANQCTDFLFLYDYILFSYTRHPQARKCIPFSN